MFDRKPDPVLRWASDHGLLLSYGAGIDLEAHRRVIAAAAALRASPLEGLRDLHPGYCTLLITLDPLAVDPEAIEDEVRRIVGGAAAPDDEENVRLVEVPVCYEDEFAPDLGEVARLHGMDTQTVVRLHSDAEYRVYFLGFAPGFPYLGGLPDALATPRLSTPRRRVPSGSVAIAGAQAGIYPFATPGGWRVLGRTPLRLFHSDRNPPALLAPGDAVRFSPVTAAEFRALFEA